MSEHSVSLIATAMSQLMKGYQTLSWGWLLTRLLQTKHRLVATDTS